MSRSSAFFLVLAAVLGQSPAAADDWPRWRGPAADGVSREKGLLGTWPAGGPQLAWRSDAVGVGFSGVSVVGDRVYTLGAVGDEERAFALDAATGKVVWSVAVGKRFANLYGDGPRSTPTAAGDALFVLAGRGRLACLDRASGAKRWAVDLAGTAGGRLMKGNIIDTDWGYCESPAVDAERVVVCPGGPKGTVAAFDRKTGEMKWRTAELTHDAAYGSPVPAVLHGEFQYVVVTGGREGRGGLVLATDKPLIVGVRADDGTVRWRCPAPYTTGPVIPTPVVAGDDVLATAGYGAGAALYRIERRDGEYAPKLVYKTKEMSNYYGGVVQANGLLYGFADPTGWKCLDFRTGEVRWEKSTSNSSAALLVAGERLYGVTTTGTVWLAPLGGDVWEPAGEFTLPAVSEGRKANSKVRVVTPPVVANGRLYVRDQELLYAYRVAAAP